MNEINVKAYAKINLSLDVLGKIDGGYHEMRMLMQSTSLCDDIRIRLNDAASFGMDCNFGFLPRDERNIALKAAKAFFAAAGLEGKGAHLSLKKRIPVGAGLAGGSTDAAAVLRGLNELCGSAMTARQLEKIGETLGSDVPFCVAGGTRLASARGEILEDMPAMPDCGIVLCKPRFSIRTPDLFAKIDARRSKIHPDTEDMIAALGEGDLRSVAQRMYNVFEDVLPRNCGEIGEIKHRLIDLGALGSAMSGTGSAVIGLFETRDEAERAWKELKGSYRECFVAQPVGRQI